MGPAIFRYELGSNLIMTGLFLNDKPSAHHEQARAIETGIIIKTVTPSRSGPNAALEASCISLNTQATPRAATD